MPAKGSQKRRRGSGSNTIRPRETASQTIAASSSIRERASQSSNRRTSTSTASASSTRHQDKQDSSALATEHSASRQSNYTVHDHNPGDDNRRPFREVDHDLDSLHEIVMAVDLSSRGAVGCAYYVAREEKLYFMEDMQLGGPDAVDSCW